MCDGDDDRLPSYREVCDALVNFDRTTHSNATVPCGGIDDNLRGRWHPLNAGRADQAALAIGRLGELSTGLVSAAIGFMLQVPNAKGAYRFRRGC